MWGYFLIAYSIIKVPGLEKAQNALLSAFFSAKLSLGWCEHMIRNQTISVPSKSRVGFAPMWMTRLFHSLPRL